MPDRRVVHITLEKCGSQWINVLTRRGIIDQLGLSNSNVTGSISCRAELMIPANSFCGPIYNMNQWEWRYWRKPGDRALVILRDPRDILISLMFAWLYSHPVDGNIQIVRRILSELHGHGDRLTYVMGAIGPCQRMIRTWSADRDATSLLVRYEDLAEDPVSGFRRILDWLGWNSCQDLLLTAIEELSFESRVGRKRGDEDCSSHFRRGLPGDWRNYFTREHGRLWETLYPGLLTAAGYEKSDDWWRTQPGAVGLGTEGSSDEASTFTNALRTRNICLEREIEEKEAMIRELTAVCHERLAAIEEKELMIHKLAAVCDERLTSMKEKESVIRSLEAANDGRFAENSSKRRHRRGRA